MPLDANGRAVFERRAGGTFACVGPRRRRRRQHRARPTTTLLVIDPADVDPPVVDLTAPADDAIDHPPVDVIGTATDANLLSYTLSVAPVGSGPFTEIARGTTR